MAFSLATAASPFDGTYWVVDGLFLAGPFPGHRERLLLERRITALCSLGIKQFVNLMETDERDRSGKPFSTYDRFAKSLGAGTDRHPIPDLGVPEPEAMTALLDTIDGSLSQGLPTYLHCWGGIGRTGTVVGCWLIRHGLSSREDVFTVLDALRSRDPERGSRPSPETAAQRAFVTEWG